MLVSLCQTGTPIGILLRRWAAWRHGIALAHYTVSVVRGHGVDDNALSHILDRHDVAAIQFVDGWTGKGSIAREVRATLQHRRRGHSPPDGLAVLVDPGDCAAVAGTTADFLVPNACLNATVSVLVSRTAGRAAPGGGPKSLRRAGSSDGCAAPGARTPTREFPAVRGQVDAHSSRRADQQHGPSFAGEWHATSLAGQYGLGDVNLVKAG